MRELHAYSVAHEEPFIVFGDAFVGGFTTVEFLSQA
jgi:hypothetical protein